MKTVVKHYEQKPQEMRFEDFADKYNLTLVYEQKKNLEWTAYFQEIGFRPSFSYKHPVDNIEPLALALFEQKKVKLKNRCLYKSIIVPKLDVTGILICERGKAPWEDPNWQE